MQVEAMTPALAVAAPVSSITVVGCGGNIGSHLCRHLARRRDVDVLRLIDGDRYAAKNLAGQDIAAEHIGQAKAAVQAKLLRQINNRLQIETSVDRVENVALGVLRAGVIIACLDSRRARQYVNQAAFRLGVPWVDAGVRADGLLARVNVYRPDAASPCLECSWSAADYEALEQIYACLGAAPDAPATNAPSALGALAAALQALEVEKIFAGQWEQVAVGKQILISAAAHRHFVTTLCRNPDCRFDHATWSIEPIDESIGTLSLRALLARTDMADTAQLRVEPHVFVRQLVCPRCGLSRNLGWRLSGRLGADGICERCARPLLALGAEVADWIGGESQLDRALTAFGLQVGDVCTLRGGGTERHIELGPVRPHAPAGQGATGDVIR